VKVHDGLALHLLDAALLLLDEVQLHGDLRPVIGGRAEHPRPNAAVGGVGAAVTGLRQHHVVGRNAANHRVGQRRAVGIPQQHLLIASVQEALVTFDTAGGVVFRLALFVDEFYAVHAAVLHVDVIQIVDHPAENAGAHGVVGTDAHAGYRKILLGLLGHRRRGYNCRRQDGAGSRDTGQSPAKYLLAKHPSSSRCCDKLDVNCFFLSNRWIDLVLERP
jgi:hypothetical protein